MTMGRTGRPVTVNRTKLTAFRLSEGEIEELDYCVEQRRKESPKTSRTDIIVEGVNRVRKSIDKKRQREERE